MKTMTIRGGFQGDVAIIPVDAIPAGAIEQPHSISVVVAHSETGHHHAIDCDAGQSVTLFATADPMVSYLRVDSTHADIVHHRAWNTHETWRLPSSVSRYYEIRRQEERAPEGWRRVED